MLSISRSRDVQLIDGYGDPSTSRTFTLVMSRLTSNQQNWRLYWTRKSLSFRSVKSAAQVSSQSLNSQFTKLSKSARKQTEWKTRVEHSIEQMKHENEIALLQVQKMIKQKEFLNAKSSCRLHLGDCRRRDEEENNSRIGSTRERLFDTFFKVQNNSAPRNFTRQT